MLMLKEGKIDTQWSIMLQGCEGEAEGVYQAALARLEATKAPGVSWHRDSVAPSWVKGFLGKRRDYLIVRSANFRRYVFLANARDFGTNLDVCWYLVYEPIVPLFPLVVGFLLISSMFLFFAPILPFSVLFNLLFLFSMVCFLGAGVLAAVWLYQRFLDVFDEQDLSAYVTVANRAVSEAVKHVCSEKHIELQRLETKSRGKHAVLA